MGIVEDRIRQRQLEAGAKATTSTVSTNGEGLGTVERRMLERGLSITRAPKTVNVSFTDGTTKKVPSADFQNFLNAVKEDGKKRGLFSQMGYDLSPYGGIEGYVDFLDYRNKATKEEKAKNLDVEETNKRIAEIDAEIETRKKESKQTQNTPGTKKPFKGGEIRRASAASAPLIQEAYSGMTEAESAIRDLREEKKQLEKDVDLAKKYRAKEEAAKRAEEQKAFYLSYNVETAKTETSALKNSLEEAKKNEADLQKKLNAANRSHSEDRESLRAQLEKEKNKIFALETKLGDTERHITEAEETQKREWYNSLPQAEDFKKYSEGGFYGNFSPRGADPRYQDMTDKEVAIYRYLANKAWEEEKKLDKDKSLTYIEKAKKRRELFDMPDKYLESLADVLEYRKGIRWGEAARDINNPIGRGAAILGYATATGMSNAIEGAASFLTGAPTEPSALDYAAEYIREDIDGFAGVAYDITQSLANMFPSVVLGAVTNPAVGAAAMGASSAGNAYSSAIMQGYSENEARTYGWMTGASEAALQYILGGIGSLGGKITNNALAKIVSKIDNAGLKLATTLGGNMASEGFEEGLQTYLEAAFRKTIFDEELNLKEVSEDALYSAMLGAVTAFLIEGPGTTATAAVNQKNAGIGKEYSKVADAVIKQGLTSDANSEAHRIAEELQKKLTAGEEITNAELGRAVRANEEATGKAFEVSEAGVELEGMPRVKIPESMNPASSGDAINEKSHNIRDMVENTAPITPGFIRNEYSKNIGNKTIRALDAIGKKLGVEIEIGEPTGEFGDNGVYNNGRIAIAKDANVLKAVISHEVTHHMQRTAPAEYNAFVEMAIEASEKLSGMEKTELINRYRQEYANGIESFTDQDAIDEITADYASRLVDDVSLFRELANSNKNVAQRVVDAVRDFLKKISTVFSKNAADKAAIEKYGTDVEGLKKVVAQWESMLATTEKAVAGGNINTADVYEGGEAKRLISPSFETEIDSWDGKSKRTFVVGRTSSVLKSLGVEDRSVVWHSGKIAEVLRKHSNMSKDIIKQVPRIMEAPIIVLKSQTSNSRITMFGEVWDIKGNPVLAVLELEPTAEGGRILNMNIIASAYGKDSNPKGFIENSELLYLDENKNRTEKWMQSVGLQLPSGTNTLGSMGTITYKDGKVNIKGVPYRKFMLGQYKNTRTSRKSKSQRSIKGQDLLSKGYSRTDAEYMDAVESGDTATAQRIVDAAATRTGYTEDAYHGTPNKDFTVFDKERVGKGNDQYGAGFYFASNKDSASAYGGRVIPARLAINNPIKIDGSAENGANLIDAGFDYLLTEEQAYEVLKRLPDIYDEEESPLGDYYDSYWEEGPQEWMIEDMASNEGNQNIGYLDSNLFRNYPNELHEALRDIVGYDGVEVTFDNGDKFYVAWFDNQMKSAEPVVYDDDGNIIPPSERFNPNKNDIRYSKKTGDLLSKDYKPRETGVNPQAAELEAEEFRAEPKDTSPRRTEESYIEETGLDEYFDDLTERAKVTSDKRIREANAALMKGPATSKKTFGEKVGESVSFIKRKMVNSADAVRKIAKTVKDDHLYGVYNRARSSMNIVSDMLKNKQTNIRGQKVGESLEGIIAPIKEKGEEYWNNLQLYLLHKHNVSRMSLKDTKAEELARTELEFFIRENPDVAAMGETELQRRSEWEDERGLKARKYLELRDNLNRAQNTNNKPIFFDSDEVPLNAEESRAFAAELLRKNPEFAQDEAKIRTYLDNLMEYRVESGLITQEEADYFKKKYPDYVPTYRDTETVQKQLSGELNIGTTVGKAKGGNEKILPLDVALSEMTKKVVRSGQKNIFANKLFELYNNNSKAFDGYITDVKEGNRDVDSEIDGFGEEKTLDNTVRFHENGKSVELTVTPELFEAFDALSKVPKEQPAVAKTWRKVNDVYKKLITTYDPTFIVRNGLKDLQDAVFNSTDLKGFAKNYPRAYKEIATGGEMWELYKAAGGLYSSRFEELQNEGVISKGGKLNLKEKLAFGNMIVEQAPRLAEFMTVYEKGDPNNSDTLSDALLAAADVTTNFGESGTWGKVLNSYYIPFLNPAIQGTAKVVRTFTGTKTAKQWMGLAVKTTLYGLGAAFLNDLINGDDEDYENLPDRTKDNYFLFPVGDGKFLKLPKGRVTAALGIVTDRVRDTIKGEKVDVGEAFSRVAENILPENPLNNNIFKAWFDADLFNEESKGRTWYGTDIENESLQSLPAGERYDSSTDYISKYVGKILGVSPKKLNYILQQYTGGAGRMVLPMLTPSEQKGDSAAGNIGLGIVSFLTSNFSTDSKLSNKVSGEFYDAVTEAERAKNSSKGTDVDKVVYKHLNRERNQMSSYNKTIRNAENDKSLKSKERRAAVRVATAERTTYQETVLDNLPEYREAVEKYLKKYPGTDEEKRIDYAYREANREIYGEKYALRVNADSDVYKKAEEKVKRGDTTWKEYYDKYFGKTDKRYKAIKNRFDVSYADFEKIEKAISKNETKADEISAIEKLGYKRGVARVIRDMYHED